MKTASLFALICLLVVMPVAVKADVKNTPPVKKEEQAKKDNVQNDKQKEKSELDWGDWQHKFKPQQRYGVGIKGKLQNAINALDKSNLINDSNGVQVSPTNNKNKQKKSLDIKKMKAELKALEKKVEQEIEDDIDY